MANYTAHHKCFDLGEWLVGTLADYALIESFKKDVNAGFISKHLFEQYKNQFDFAGTDWALYSTLRNYPMGNLEEEYLLLNQHRMPVHLIWGTEDTVVPYAASEEVRTCLESARFDSIPGASHSLLYAQPEAVNPLLIKFFK